MPSGVITLFTLVSDIAMFVLKRDVKLQLTNSVYSYNMRVIFCVNFLLPFSSIPAGLSILGCLTAYQSPSINRNGPQRRCLLPQRHCDCRVRVRVKALICRKTSQNGQPCPKQVRCSRIQLRCGPLRSVAVISHTPSTLHPFTEFSVISLTWQIRLNLCFFRTTQVHNPNGKSIAVQPYLYSSRQKVSIQWAPLSPKIAPSHRDLDPHLIHGSLDPSEFSAQTASRSIQLLFSGLTVTDRPIDRQTDHAILGR